jgi:hypothetical protein
MVGSVLLDKSAAPMTLKSSPERLGTTPRVARSRPWALYRPFVRDTASFFQAARR